MRNPVVETLVLLFTLAALAGCGQTGPLFLPGNTSEIMTAPPANEQLEESDEDEDDDEDNNAITERR